MSSYYQKKKAAREKIESGAFSKRENVLGEMVDEKPYQVMYSSGFPGYFIYMVTGDYGGYGPDRKLTPWGFQYYEDWMYFTDGVTPAAYTLPADYEFHLEFFEVPAWLDKYYGNLDSDDYLYLTRIISGHQHIINAPAPQNKSVAMQWLNVKLEEVSKAPFAPTNLGLKWQGPRAEFVELVHALFNAGALTITEKGGRDGATKRLGEALGIKGTTPYSTVLNDIKSRNNDRQTPLLDRLKERFFLPEKD
jgi:hypothetical protein